MSFSLLLATKRRLFVSYAFTSSSASTTLKPYGLRWKSSISRRSWSSLVLPSSGSPDDACGDDLPKLQRRIDALNGGVHINVRSPKQVSIAIFGSPQSATMQKIEQATKDTSLSPEKRELASLILEQTISSKKLKTRHLSQTVSPAKPSYISAGDNTDTSADLLDQLPASRPCVGVIHTSAGYHLVEVSMEERSVTYSERLTQEAVSCRLEAYPPADPLLFIPTPNEEAKAKTLSGGAARPPFLPRSPRRSLSIESGEGRLLDASAAIDGARIRVENLSPSLVPSSKLAGGTDAARYNQAVVAFFLEQHQEPTMSEHSQPGTRRTTFEDFTMVQSTSCTNPLYKETARQLGLMEDPNIPSLVLNVLDETAPTATRKFLHRYLMVPPPPEVAQAMASVVKALMDPQQAQSLPKLVVPRLGKMLTFILEGKADASIYAELLKALGVTRCLLQQEKENIPIDALLTLSSHGSGLFAKSDSFLERCQQAIEAIETVLSHEHHVTGDLQPAFVDDRLLDTVTNDRHIPQSFFDRHEASWRGQIQHGIAPHAYRQVEEAAEALCHAVKEDFIRDNNANEGLIKSDSHNFFILALPKIPENAREAAKDFHRPRNRFNEAIDNRFTTKRVENAMSDYKEACDAAHTAVRSALTRLAQHLQDNDHIPTIRQSTHFNLALSAAFHHAKKATHRGWHLAEVVDSSESARFVGLWPYWMPNSTAVSNNFDLDGMFLLTAPNMSGKSTLMRSTAAAALLTVCGLCAPLKEGSWVPQFDTLFLRGASADVPAENKSALGAEMEDIAALQRGSSEKCLVFVDEIGRGTSPRDGTLLAAAILEKMARKGMTGIFATHLHDLLKLPLHSQERIIEKQMDLVRKNEQWTYKLKDGVCYDSLALVTAEQFGLSQDIIRRAKELGHYLPQDDFDRMAPMTSRLINNIDAEGEDPSKLDFGGMREIAESITGQKSFEVPPGHNPPPSLEGAWCIYLLELLYDAHPLYYVGESGNISDRLRTHRNRGPEWSQSRSFVIPVANKSEARRYESRLIQYLVQSGVSMKSTTDGLSKRLG